MADIDCPDCGGCDCPDCGDCNCDCCDASNCGFSDGFLLGCISGNICDGCCDACYSTSGINNTRNNNSGCGWLIAGLVVLILVFCFWPSSCENENKSNKYKKDQNLWTIIEIQKEKHWFAKDGNTLLENKETKQRKLVTGVLGKVGEEIRQ